MLSCREAVEKLYEYIDRQLSEDEMNEVRKHLDRCPSCEDHFRFEEGVLRRVHQACREVETPPALRERVMEMCRQSKQQS